MSAAAAKAVAQFIADNGLGTAGEDLYRDFLPASPDEVVSVMGIGGVPTYALAGAMGVVTGQVQIQIRAATTDYVVAEQRSSQILYALDTMDTYRPTPPADEWVTEILAVTATDVPVLLERDEHERPVFITVYSVVYLPQEPL